MQVEKNTISFYFFVGIFPMSLVFDSVRVLMWRGGAGGAEQGAQVGGVKAKDTVA